MGLLGLFFIIGTLNSGAGDGVSSSSLASGNGSADATATPQLELLSYNWSRSSDMFVTVEGQVKNISSEPMENVTAVSTFYTADGTFVTSDDALIDFNPILPGQTSPFSTISSYNPAMEKAGVEFKYLIGGTIATKRSE